MLFTDIVGYSKLPIHQQRAVVECLNEIVQGTDEFQAAETTGRLTKIESSLGNGEKCTVVSAFVSLAFVGLAAAHQPRILRGNNLHY